MGVSLSGSNDSDKLSKSSLSNEYPMTADRTNMAITEHVALQGDLAAAAIANAKTAVRYFFNGVTQNGTPNTGDIIVWIDNTTTSNGNALTYVTTDHASSGTALCSSILLSSVQTVFTDSASLYSRGLPVVAGTVKSVTIPITKQGTLSQTILSIGVLTSLAQNAAPDGVAVNIYCVGIAA